MRIQRSFLILCTLCALLASTVAAAPLRPTHAPHAIVTSVHELASRAGIEMLRSGGNAIDAAVATGFALAVVHPQAGNLGGGGFLLLRNDTGETHFIDFREKAPAAATANMYLDAHGNVIPESSTDSSVVGYKSIGVPGSVAGLVYAEKQYGKLSIEKVMAPAIKFARDGFPLAYEDAQALKDDDYLTQFPESKRFFLRDGNYYRPSELLKQPELARTLERLAKDPDTFYHGAMARELVAGIHKGAPPVQPLAICVVSVSRLHRKVLLLHRHLEVVITAGSAVFVRCITHAVLGSQFLDNAGVDIADGFFFRNFKETSTSFFRNPLKNFLAIGTRDRKSVV